MEFTAIGYTVNIAARLEQATKILKTPILVSESTIENIKDLYIYENLGPIALPDQKEKIQVFAILGSKHPLRNEHQQKLT